MPDTLKQVVDRVKAAKTEIANAITVKGGTVGANDGLEDFASDIATIPSGGGGTSQPRKDVNFYDYDGTIVNSYTAAEFAELTAMPENPTHEGLTAQGWNWSLSDAKSYVTSYGKLEIGQMYITSDGKTRLYITLNEGRTSPVLQLYLKSNTEIDIDWGDDSTHSTFISKSAEYKSERHNYASAGDYVIAITVVSGGIEIRSYNSNSASILSNGDGNLNSPDGGYRAAIRKVEIGSSVSAIEDRSFNLCPQLLSITIPKTVTNMGGNVFNSCYSLKSVTIPDSLSVIRVYCMANCYSLSSVTIPNSVSGIDSNAFTNCYSLLLVTIPNSVTTIDAYSFNGCKSLSLVKIPTSVTNIGSVVFYGTNLSDITIPNSVTTIGNNTFSSCYSLATITIDKPEGSISGSPWGATTGSYTNTQIIWTG